MNILNRTLLRSLILLFCSSCFSIPTLKAQVYFDSVYQDYIFVYKKVREFDMSFTEAMPITSSKTFILENEHIVPAIKEYKKKYIEYTEQDILVELSADVSIKFLKEQLSELECEHDYDTYERYKSAYTEYMCNCASKRAKVMSGYKWKAKKDSVMKSCTKSFLKNLDDSELKSKLNKLNPEQKVALQECAKVYSYINCEMFTVEVIGACINRAERYYYVEKGLKMKREAIKLNKYLKEQQQLPSEVYLKGQNVTDSYSLLFLKARKSLREKNIQVYDIQDWDNIYSVFYVEGKQDVKIVFGANYQFDFKEGKVILKGMSYMSVNDMDKNTLLKKNIKRLSASPVMGGSEK